MSYLRIATPFLVGAMMAFSGAAITVANAASVVKYNSSSFNAALKSGKPVVVHVHADWCITCVRQQKPIRTELKKKNYSRVKAFQVNYDKDRDFLQRYRINTQSTIMVFKKGRLVTKSVGQTSPAVISAVLRKAL